MKKDSQNKIKKALGASRSIPISDKKVSTPFAWIDQACILKEKLKSSGGRPSDKKKIHAQLSNKDTKELEVTSYRPPCIDHQIKFHKQCLYVFRKHLALHHWQWVHNIKNQAVYKEWNFLSKLIGFKHNYTVNYSAKCAVWGLFLKGVPDSKFLVYWSVEGLTVQYQNGMTLGNQESIVDHLCTLLVNGKNDEEIMKEIISNKRRI